MNGGQLFDQLTASQILREVLLHIVTAYLTWELGAAKDILLV
jgi:hypothetical protein